MHFSFLKAFHKAASDERKMVDKKALLKKMEKGLKEGEFKMYLQFIVDSQTQKLASAEALSRWECEGELVPPGAYIDLMEESGLIVQLDYYMFEKACAKLSAWTGSAFEDIILSSNFSRVTISQKDFVERIREIADKYAFDRSKLLLEITEDSMEQNLAVATHNMLKVKEFGFLIALDDIGSGYTSLIKLCEYPIDIVKIDRSILLKAKEERGKKLFWGIISLAHYLNLLVVCEGVETAEQNTVATQGACDYIQGWYYSKALPEQQAEAFAREYMGQ